MLLLRYQLPQLPYKYKRVVASDIRRRDQTDTGPEEIRADSDTTALELFSGSDCCCLGGCSWVLSMLALVLLEESMYVSYRRQRDSMTP